MPILAVFLIISYETINILIFWTKTMVHINNRCNICWRTFFFIDGKHFFFFFAETTFYMITIFFLCRIKLWVVFVAVRL
jgi:hypothetical protein